MPKRQMCRQGSMSEWTPQSLARRWRRAMAVVASLALVAVVGCGTPYHAPWEVEHSRESAFQELAPRVEITLRDSWVGGFEDRFGTQLLGARHDLQLARHCSGEWSVTYPEDTEGLPAPGTELRLWAQTHKRQLDTSGDGAVGATGVMASNGVAAVFQVTPEIDGALFVNGFVWIVVATLDEVQVSVSDLLAKSREPRWFPWLASRPPTPQMPSDLGDICQGPAEDTTTDGQEKKSAPRPRPQRGRPR